MTSRPHTMSPAAPPVASPVDAGRQLQVHLFVRGHVDDGLRARLAQIVATAASSDASEGGTWTPRHASFGALSQRSWALAELVDLLERGQREKTLPPLSFQAYDRALWKEYGDVVMATPELGRFEGRCDSQGSVVLTDRRIAAAFTGAGGDAANVLARLAGLPWSTELGLLTPPSPALGDGDGEGDGDQPARSSALGTSGIALRRP